MCVCVYIYAYIQTLFATVRFLIYIIYLLFILKLPQDILFSLLGTCFESYCALILDVYKRQVTFILNICEVERLFYLLFAVN